MASTGQGNRNNQLFASACALFELVNAGTLGRDQAESGLRDAARTAGLDDQEIEGRFRSAWKKVGEKARDLSHVGTKSKERGKAAEIIDEVTGLVETVDNEHRLARAVLKAKFHHPDRPTLCFWMGDWCVWQNGEWKATPNKEIDAAVTEVVRSEFEAHAKSTEMPVKSVSTRLTANVTAALRGLVMLSEREYPSQPMWLFGDGPDPAECVNFRNGILHLPTLIDHGPETALTPPTPRFFAASAVRYDFDPKASKPNQWYEFLDAIWDDDPESVEALQQWFGYLLTMDTSRQKALMIEGPTRSGKGTIARVLTAMVGSDNVTAPTLTSLGQHFGLQTLIGRSIAFCNESRLSARSDAPAIVERVLSISGEDEQSISRKHTTDWNGKLGVRFVFSTNEMPRLTDAAGALLSRFVFLKLTRSFVGREDRELGNKLVAESPGILLWAIHGWSKLRESGLFLQPKSAVAAMTEWQEMINPLGGFVAERCLVGPDLLNLYGEPATTETKTLYRAWV
ncbi:phage/plasmid primase, P4 family, partial [Paludisphaera rhizosphaerae]|uniref:phage/plasmid primase, P4 family n=1 Tax=Paludisphaera rhizosphaerae TaxID=2711216 RepID=UPI001F0F89B6